MSAILLINPMNEGMSASSLAAFVDLIVFESNERKSEKIKS